MSDPSEAHRDHPANRWRTLASREAYRNAWIRVREDRVIRPDGDEGIYGVIEIKPAVFIVAVTDEGNVLLVRLFRYPTGTHSWEVPAGSSDGQEVRVAAERELREETGMNAGQWDAIGVYESLNGVADARCHVFLARRLSPAEGDEREEEGITDVRAFSWRELRRMILDGELTDGETLSCLMIAETWLRENGPFPE
jgi:8-oxo-dGTP pyrophosphatase MutT (NUDIX family)